MRAEGSEGSREPGPRRLVRVLVPGALVPGARDHDPVGLDRDGHGPVAGPVLRIHGIVLNRGVEPEPVALVPVVERALERRGLAAAAAATPAPPPAHRRTVAGALVVLI